MAKTELFVRQQSGGMYAVVAEDMTTGNIFFVDSGTSGATDGAGYGQNPDAPTATIDYAVSLCTANNGDRIYVMPGHTETVTAAAGLALDVAGITIIGIGNGPDTPVVTLTTADTADVDVDAAGITVENIHFTSGFADVAVCLDVNATDFTLRRCRFTEAADDQNFLVCVQDAAAAASDRITIEDCYALQDDASNTHFVNFAGTGKGHIVRRNMLLGDWGTMCIGGAGVVTFATILDNAISNVASDADSCINFAAAATGMCMRNLCCGAAAQANGVTATAMAIAQNYYGVITEDLSAILDPIAT